jgi:pimeloyl-ACP methyl ester carboxylesterase
LPGVGVGGLSLYYEEKGTGPPLVFVHGIPTDYIVQRALQRSCKRIYGIGLRSAS